MKKTYKKIRMMQAAIRECEKELQAVKQLPFYSLFNKEAQQEVDIRAITVSLSELHRQKQELLAKLHREIGQALQNSA